MRSFASLLNEAIARMAHVGESFDLPCTPEEFTGALEEVYDAVSSQPPLQTRFLVIYADGDRYVRLMPAATPPS
jgi:hypothetical protein